MKINYSLKRVLLLTKANIVENSRYYILSLVIATLLVTFICMTVSFNMLNPENNISSNVNFNINGATMSSNSENIGKVLTAIMGGIFVGMLLILCAVHLFTLFANSLKKLKQPYKYALPANVSEKYTANLIIAFILVPIAISLVNLIAIFTTNILLLFFSTTEFQYRISEVLELLGKVIDDPYEIVKIFTIYGLILLGVIYKAGVKNKLLAFIISFIIVAAVFTFDSLPERLGIDANLNIYLLPIVWIVTYISFKRKELRS